MGGFLRGAILFVFGAHLLTISRTRKFSLLKLSVWSRIAPDVMFQFSPRYGKTSGMQSALSQKPQTKACKPSNWTTSMYLIFIPEVVTHTLLNQMPLMTRENLVEITCQI